MKLHLFITNNHLIIIIPFGNTIKKGLNMKKILLVDDEENVLQALFRIFKRSSIYNSCNIKLLSNPIEALQYSKEHKLDLVISDYRMPQMDGVSFLKEIKEIQPDCGRMLLTAGTDLNALMTAINEVEIIKYLIKPWDDAELITAVEDALMRNQNDLENKALADQLRLKNGTLTPEEFEKRKLESMEPGITKVNWGPDGELILDDEI